MKELDSLKLSGIILIALGVIETFILILVFIEEFSFSGGRLFYIYFGYKLLNKDLKYYKYVKFTFMALFTMILAGIFTSLFFLGQLLITDNLHLSFEVNILFILIMTMYSVFIIQLVYFLHHPNTLSTLGLKSRVIVKSGVWPIESSGDLIVI